MQHLAHDIAAALQVARPRDPLGRVRWLFGAFAVLSALAAVPVVFLLDSKADSPTQLVAVAAALVLAATWALAVLGGRFGPLEDAITIAAIGVVVAAMRASDTPESLFGLSFAAVLFASLFGSLPRVILRAAVLAAMQAALVWEADADAATMASLTIASISVAGVIHALPTFVQRYEASARRAQILAATGLSLVAAADLPGIARTAVEGAYAVCAALPNARVWLALTDAWAVVDEAASGDQRAGQGPALKIVAAAGEDADLCESRILDARLLGEVVDWAVDQQPLCPTAMQARQLADAGVPVLDGSMLVTRVCVDGAPRGCLVLETSADLPSEVPGAIAALVTQISLAVSRSDLQVQMIERNSAERFEALVQNSSDVITIVDDHGLIRFQSPSAKHVFGYEPESLVGTPAAALVHPDDRESVALAFRGTVRTSSDDYPRLPVIECRMRHADGSWRFVETRLSNLADVPAVAGIVLNTRDVTERHGLEEELRHQAFHDALTGLANRALFVNRVEHAVTRSVREGATVAVLFIDLDGFRRLNDSLGYAAGDAALVAVAERLRTCVRAPDTVARLGADEFGVLLDRLGSPADAPIAAERVIDVLRQPLALSGASVELQPFIGIATSVGGDESAEELLRNGAVAMHRAKTFDGGYTIFDPEMHAAALRRLEVESQLRRAIEEEQLVLHYQPTIELETGNFTGVEALVRWQHPTRGLVPPLEFIPLAEETGLIVPLGRWALRESCRQVRRWQQEISNEVPLCLSVNLSARQLRHPSLVRDVADALDDSGLLPSRLILEITESVLMIDTAATLNKLFQLKAIGVRLAIDDFGTGYSSFSYLRRFPIDILKIDKSFVDGVATEPTAGALVDAMIRIGKTLRMETVAEGVERIEQANELRALKCDVAQGFLFSRPLAQEALTKLLLDRERERQEHRASAA